MKNYKDNISPDINVFTCTIGRRATQAKYFVSDPGQIVTIMEQLNSAKHKVKVGGGLNKRKTHRMQSLANFNMEMKFGKLAAEAKGSSAARMGVIGPTRVITS